MRWTRKSIVAAIQKLHAQGTELNYAAAEAQNLNLVRAAAWHFGTWRRAVEAAGIDYESIGKYRRWNRERIVARIRELDTQGADLSWRSVSIDLDPPLAAAALRPNGFNSWREAIAAAGLDINDVARYQLWDEERVVRDIKALHRARAALSSKAVQTANQPLFCAARRRFGSWDDAIAAAGLSSENTRLRRVHAPHELNGNTHNGTQNGAQKSESRKSELRNQSAKAGAKIPAARKSGQSASVTVATAKSPVEKTESAKASGRTPNKKVAALEKLGKSSPGQAGGAAQKPKAASESQVGKGAKTKAPKTAGSKTDKTKTPKSGIITAKSASAKNGGRKRA